MQSQNPWGAFGQQQQTSPQNNFSFGQPSSQPSFSSGAAAPFGQSAPSMPTASGFNFGAQPSQQPASAFTFGAAIQSQQQHQGFSFGAAATQPPPQQPPQQQQRTGFDFGSGVQKQQQNTKASLQPKFGGGVTGPSNTQHQRHIYRNTDKNNDDDDEEGGIDYEAMKRNALAAMPRFQGSSHGASPPPPPPPPPQQHARSKPAAKSAKAPATSDDPGEKARRAQRSARFAPVSERSTISTTPPFTTPASSPFPQQQELQLPPLAPPPGLAKPLSFSNLVHAGIHPQQQQQQHSAAFIPHSSSQLHAGATAAYTNNRTVGDDDDASIHKKAIVGICEDMCPATERERRQNMSDIQIFERIDPANPNLTSADLAVKRFARTVDDPQPPDFRSRGALSRTMAYLRHLLDRTDVRFGLVHKFLWDRYRSVRQDLYIQGITDGFGIGIFEEIVRFHVLCEHELCGEDQSVTDMEGFNSHLNMEQMNKALISLNDMYVKAAADGAPSPCEAEFRAYHLLSLMAQHGKFKGDHQAFLSTLQSLRPEVRGSPLVQWVLQIRAAFSSGNFVRFFTLVQEAAYLPSCLAHIYFPAVRARALRTLSETLSPSAGRPALVELSWLKHVLMMDSEEEAAAFCALHGFSEISNRNDGGGAVVSVVTLYKGSFVEPPPPVARNPSHAISCKAPGMRSVCVTSPVVGQLLSPEEVGRLHEEAKRKEEERRQLAMAAHLEAQRAREEALRRDQEMAAAQQEAAAEQLRLHQEAENLKLRAEAEEMARRRLIEEEAERQRHAAIAAEAKRMQEEEAERERQRRALRAAEEAARRAAEEAEARRREEERRRREQEELERRQREEEERRKIEEFRQKVLQRRFFTRWVVEMRRRVAEEERKQRIAASLKACKVHVPAYSQKEYDEMNMDAAFNHLDIHDSITPTPLHHEKRNVPLDLPSLIGSFLAQRNPDAQSLYWKVTVIAPTSLPMLPASASLASASHYSSILKWLRVQFSTPTRASPSSSSTSSSSTLIYINGPVEIDDGRNISLKTSAALPLHSSNTFSADHPADDSLSSRSSLEAIAGTSALIIVATEEENDEATCRRALAALESTLGRISASYCINTNTHPHTKKTPSVPAAVMHDQEQRQGPPLLIPVLFIAATEHIAQQWCKVWQQHHQRYTSSLSSSEETFFSSFLALGLQQQQQHTHHPPSLPPSFLSTSIPMQWYSQHQLQKGIQWLASKAPQQTPLNIIPLENIVRDAFVAVSHALPFHASSSTSSSFVPAPAHYTVLEERNAEYESALLSAISLVQSTLEASHSSREARWKWPPPELFSSPLNTWHTHSVYAHSCKKLKELAECVVGLRRKQSISGENKMGETYPLEVQLCIAKVLSRIKDSDKNEKIDMGNLPVEVVLPSLVLDSFFENLAEEQEILRQYLTKEEFLRRTLHPNKGSLLTPTPEKISYHSTPPLPTTATASFFPMASSPSFPFSPPAPGPPGGAVGATTTTTTNMMMRDSSSSPSKQHKRKWRHSPDDDSRAAAPQEYQTTTIRGGNINGFKDLVLEKGLSLLEEHIALEKSMDVKLKSELVDIGVVSHHHTKRSLSPPFSSHHHLPCLYSEKKEGDGRLDDDGNVLRELQSQVVAERNASRSLWARMTAMASSLF